MTTCNHHDGFSKFARNEHSQFGEDGIIEAVLDNLRFKDNWCVEFGAWDGIHLSNTFNLIKNFSYNAVLIEANKRKFRELVTNMSPYNVVVKNSFITFEGPNTLDNLLSDTDVPLNFDLLSIDIDGNDYWIFESITSYHPKLICVEYNPSIPNDVDYIQPRDFSIKRGASAKSLCSLALKKGYELVATTQTNLIFVDSIIYADMPLKDNSLSFLRDDSDCKVYVFTGYDGEVILSQPLHFYWHSLNVTQKNFQYLPSYLREFPSDYTLFQKFLFALFLIAKSPLGGFKRISKKLQNLLFDS